MLDIYVWAKKGNKSSIEAETKHQSNMWQF